MNEQNFKFDDSGLRNLLKMMGDGHDHSVRIGIFGGVHKEAGEKRKIGSDQGRNGSRKASKTPSDMTNADVGFLTEFGRPRMGNKSAIPARSWLRMPIVTKINDIAKDSARSFGEALKNGDVVKFLTVLGINAEKWIQLAFDTRGFGSWAPNAAATIEAKGSDAPNIDTAQLRRAVASMVV